jgi:DNA-directed RNA polymerase specialized sigma24 family protein
MSALLKEAWLLEHYGLRLSIKQLAEVLQLGLSTVNNKIGDGTLGVRTYLDGGRRFADVRDVADYLEQLRETAA